MELDKFTWLPLYKPETRPLHKPETRPLYKPESGT